MSKHRDRFTILLKLYIWPDFLFQSFVLLWCFAA